MSLNRLISHILRTGGGIVNPASRASNILPVSSIQCRSHSHDSDGKHDDHDHGGKPKRRKGKTPAGRFDDKWEHDTDESVEVYSEQEPLQRFPDNKNPVTGEIGGPRGPEPTRYGDWERKGRVTDF